VAAPLKLKRQAVANVSQSSTPTTKNLPVASILVDTPVSHLEGVYDYLVPELLSIDATAGSKVLVDFGNTKTEGIILQRKDKSDQDKKLKPILELAAPSGLISKSMLEHVESVRNRFGGSFWSILNSSIPGRVLKEEKVLISTEINTIRLPYESPEMREIIGRADYGQLLGKQRIKWGISFPLAIDPNWFLVEVVKLRAQVSQVLLLVPDEKDITYISALLSNVFGDGVVELGSHLSKSVRYRNFLRSRFNSPSVIISTRSGVFTHLEKNATVIVLSDLDESHYEIHAPGWNPVMLRCYVIMILLLFLYLLRTL
jgi:primosomal protein N' (replication factor Y) (superfamily II helicase)